MNKEQFSQFMNWLKTDNYNLWQSIMKGHRKPIKFDQIIQKYFSSTLSENRQ